MEIRSQRRYRSNHRHFIIYIKRAQRSVALRCTDHRWCLLSTQWKRTPWQKPMAHLEYRRGSFPRILCLRLACVHCCRWSEDHQSHPEIPMNCFVKQQFIKFLKKMKTSSLRCKRNNHRTVDQYRGSSYEGAMDWRSFQSRHCRSSDQLWASGRFAGC